MDAKKTGQLIQQMRKERGMTQAELAGRLRVTDKAVSRWERGIGCPDISLLEPLAEALHVTVLDILRGERTEEEEISVREAEDTLAEAARLAKKEKQTALRRALLAGTVLLIGVAMLVCGITWRLAMQEALDLIAGADGPSAVFVAWPVVPGIPVALAVAGGVLILAAVLFMKPRKQENIKVILLHSQLRRDLSRSVFAKQCAIRIDKQQKERYNNVVIDNDVII